MIFASFTHYRQHSRSIMRWALLTLTAGRLSAASFIANPSFEANYNATFPGYSTINNWTAPGGGIGINQATGPFHNIGTPIPDGTRVALLQGSTSISQVITGLAIGKTYWLQFYYDTRDCCGAHDVTLTTRWQNGADASTVIDSIASVPVSRNGAPYKFRQVSFTPQAASGTLTFAAAVVGDATALIDAVNLIQRDPGQVIMRNPSFEATATPTGTGVTTNIAGWTQSGSVGVALTGIAGPANNGTPTDQDRVAFITGVGLLSQTIDNLVVGTTYQLRFSTNASTGSAPRLRVEIGGTTAWENTVLPVAGTAPYSIQTLTFTATTASTPLTFRQLTAGASVLLDDVRIIGEQDTLPCLAFEPVATLIAPGQTSQIDVIVPAARIARGPAVIKIRTPNPSVARIIGAIDGVATLTFQPGGPTTLPLQIQSVTRGRVLFEVLDSGGLCLDAAPSVAVTLAYVRNPSFEFNAPPSGGVGLIGPKGIAGWQTVDQQAGLNSLSQPAYLDNGTIPDQTQVSILQSTGAHLRQRISGLRPGRRYAVQFWYNRRACCAQPVGTFPQVDALIKLGARELGQLTNVQPVGGTQPYRLADIPFVAEEMGGELEISITVLQGDGTLLIDGVSIIERMADEIVIANPGFESTGPNATGVGYLSIDRLGGWRITGSSGTNDESLGPFADNGDAPEGDTVYFQQNAGSLRQVLTGFIPGQTYTLSFAANVRNCCSGIGDESYPLEVWLGSQQLLAETLRPVGGSEPYTRRYVIFTAAGTTAELTFKNGTITAGDRSLLLDDIHIFTGAIGPQGTPPVPLLSPAFTDALRLAWPADTLGQIRLQWSLDLRPGSWMDSTTVPFTEGTDTVIYEPQDDTRRFYRLIRP